MFRLEIDSKGHRFIADMVFSFVGNKAEVDQSARREYNYHQCVAFLTNLQVV